MDAIQTNMEAALPLVEQRHPRVNSAWHGTLADIYANRAARLLYECDRFSANDPELEDICSAIAPENPEMAQRWWLNAESGDMDAARNLLIRASNPLRPVVLESALARGLPQPVLQEMTNIVWNHDWNWWQYWNSWNCGASHIVDVFLQVKFSTEHLPEWIEVWRGAGWNPQGGDDCDPASVVAGGMSWTRRRSLAHWFAGRYDRQIKAVGRCLLERSQVLAHITERDEDEIVVALWELEDWGWIELELEPYDSSLADLEERRPSRIPPHLRA